MEATILNELSIGDINLKYEDTGSGLLPVLFIHGFPFDKSTWLPQLEALKDKYRIITPDLRGFGGSTKGTEPISIDLLADDIVDLLDKLEIEKAVICGLSMGGYIALNMYKRYPNRISALVLCDTQCLADTPAGKEKRYNTMLKVASEGLEEFAEGFVQNALSSTTISNNPKLVSSIRNLILSASPQSVTETLEALATREDTCSILHTINVPTLIVCGMEDKLTPPPLSEFMHTNIKDSTLKLMDKVGHLSNLENPELFNKYLKEFLKGL